MRSQTNDVINTFGPVSPTLRSIEHEVSKISLALEGLNDNAKQRQQCMLSNKNDFQNPIYKIKSSLIVTGHKKSY